jgi:ketosteroid isomerase-like protein
MIWVRRGVVSLLGVVVLAAAPPSKPSVEAVRADVQGVVKAYVEAQNKVDASAIMEMVSKSPGVASISMGEITRGWEAIRNDVDSTVGSEGQAKIALGTIDVNQLGSGFALAFAPCTITFAPEQGGLQLRGALTLVLEKSGVNWKVLHEHASAQLPTAEGD